MRGYRPFGKAIVRAVALFLLASASPSTQAASRENVPCTDSSGHITTDTTWTLPNSPYVVGDVIIAEGVTLTIEPGVVVKFADWTSSLWVGGDLVAEGTAAQPIVFTSIKDDAHGGDTNGDGAATSPAPDDWGDVDFSASSSGSLQHVWIGYGGGDWANANIEIWGTSDVAIRDTTIAYAWGDGIDFHGFGDTRPVSLTANTFLSNTNYAVYAQLDDEVADVTLAGNTSSGSPHNGFGFGGTVSGTVTYSTEDGLPFIVTDATVRDGATLTFTPGTLVKFAGWSSSLWVGGNLVAEGTAAQPIVFTSIKDDAHGGDTNGDGAATSPAPDDWGDVDFSASSSGSLQHVWIGYGGG
ncbi:MAG: hypothetical protein PVH41_17010, partial [Anaerolineae bacterium]